MIRRLIAIILIIIANQSGLAATLEYTLEPYPFNNEQDTVRFTHLTNEIRCVVCQFQSIAESNAPIAADLRNKVYHMVKDHKTNDEIKDYLVKRYGERILLQPRLNHLTLLLWLSPILLLLAAGYLLRQGVKSQQ